MPTTQNIICSVSRCASEMFALLLVFFCNFLFGFYFNYFCFFRFLQNQENSPNWARYNPNNRKIAKRSRLHATAACPAHKLLTQMREYRHTHTHFAHPLHRSVRCYNIYRVSICIHIPYVYIYIADMMSSLLLPVYL